MIAVVCYVLQNWDCCCVLRVAKLAPVNTNEHENQIRFIKSQ